METYAVFEDGTASRIVLDFFTTDASDEPVRVACLGIEDRQVVHSAQNGCLSAYHLLHRRGYIEPGERLFPSCQFADGQANLRARGGSAGLAFCLKFAGEVQQMRTGRGPGCSVAATGVIENGSREAGVGRVEGIQAKVQAALRVLGPGDKLFLPAGNEGEVDTARREELRSKGVQLVPVATVEEALLRLIPAGEDPRVDDGTRGVRWWWAAGLAVVLALGTWAAGHWLTREAPTVEEVAIWCEQGEFERASRWLETWVADGGVVGERAGYLYRQLEDRLGVAVDLYRLPVVKKGMQPERLSAAAGQAELASGDLFRVTATVGDSCYLYGFRMDDVGRVGLLSTALAPEGPSLMRAGVTYYLPENTDSWFQVGGDGAREMLYLVGARMRSRDLEQAYRKLQDAQGGERERWRRTLESRLELRKQASEVGLEGVYYRELVLEQGVLSSGADVR